MINEGSSSGQKLVRQLDAGDTLVVPSLDRCGRSLQDPITMVAELRERGIGFTSLHEEPDTIPGGRLVFRLFGASWYWA
ncbi:recombinase family protein [Streptomyces sp. NPDC059629]|uniref:recombinase family protein n=1 Tax=Streptomyces sp. NPDC059629 TaxID=3346889 RepID=UPI0036742480